MNDLRDHVLSEGGVIAETEGEGHKVGLVMRHQVQQAHLTVQSQRKPGAHTFRQRRGVRWGGGGEGDLDTKGKGLLCPLCDALSLLSPLSCPFCAVPCVMSPVCLLLCFLSV